MADYVRKIASLITEDPDVFSTYRKAWKKGSALNLSDYHKVVGALKEIARRNECELDESKLTVQLIPPGFVIKNIHLDCGNPKKKLELSQRLADASGDDDIRHTFDENLRINLYNAISAQFANMVRDQFNLEVTHQALDVGPDSDIDRAEILPMCTVIAPSVSVRPEEPIAPMGDMGADLGMDAGLGGPADDMDLPPEFNALADGAGDFGLDEPDEPVLGAEPADAGQPAPEDEEMLEFEFIDRIADMITEDPDLFAPDRSA